MTAPSMPTQDKELTRLEKINSRLTSLRISLENKENCLRQFISRTHDDVNLNQISTEESGAIEPLTLILFDIENTLSDCEGITNQLEILENKLLEIG